MTARWKQLGLLGSTLVADAVGASCVTTLLPTIGQALGLSLAHLGVLTAANKLAGVVVSPAWMLLARRWDRKGVLVVAAGLWGGWSIAAGFATSFMQLLVLTSVMAAGFAGAFPIVTEILADLFDDRARARAVGLLYASVSLFTGLAGALTGQLTRFHDGWRMGLWSGGAITVLAGLATLLLFRDPGLGTAEPAVARPGVPVRSTMGVLFAVRSFAVMLLSRALSGHLVIANLGVIFLVEVRGFPNSVAALVWAPFSIGYVLGCLGGALAVERLHEWMPRTGRVLFLQLAQFAFAAAAYGATQIDWGGIGPYMAWWLVLGALQGVNPGVNRPIVMAVVLPELRGWAFVVMIAIVESAAWASYSIGAGWLGERFGLQVVFQTVLVWAMCLNGLVVTVLYWSYGPDADRVQSILRGRAAAQGSA